MSARDAILRRVGAAVRHEIAHPGAFRRGATPGPVSLWAAFAEKLRSVGGAAVGPLPRAKLEPTLRGLCVPGRVVTDASTGLGEGPWTEVDDEVEPRTLADVKLAILRGSIGVAENAAVAVEGKYVRVRALPFLCEELVLLLDLAAIVPDMHEAVARMPADATRFHHFTWISGPSKTADIEQTLVLGAHGPRSLVVVGIRTP